MKQLREYIRELLKEEGLLGKWPWPTASRGDLPDEPDTEIEKKLYQQLHKHFATSSYRVKGGPPLDAESVKAIQQIIAAGDYPTTFERVEGSTAMRGMRVKYSWVKKYVPQALDQLPEEGHGGDWNAEVPVDFNYTSKGKYGAVSSWTNDFKVARSFTTQWSKDTTPIILHADTSSGFFMSTTSFSSYKDGIYKDEYGIEKLNPQGRGEKEILLFGNCKIVAVQLDGSKKTHETGILGYI